MKRYMVLIPCLALAACVESAGTLETGDGFDTAQDDRSRGSIAQGRSGDYVFSLTRDEGACTALFEDPASAGATDLAQLCCTDGGRGTATVVYGSDSTPERVVYAVDGSGGGTITF